MEPTAADHHRAADTDVADDDALLCPACGYDLRGTSGDRCSECGETIDRLAPLSSAIPWTRRKVEGRFKAYIKTVWQMTFGGKSVRLEHRKAQDTKSARRFAWVTGALLGLALAGVFISIWVEEKGLRFLEIDRAQFQSPVTWGPSGRLPAWLQDVVVPWSAGATIPGVIPILLFLVGLHWTLASPRAFFRLKEGSARKREAAEAVGGYAVGPLAWFFPAVVCGWLGAALLADHHQLSGGVLMGVAWVYCAATIMGIARIAQWSARVKDKGFASWFLTIPLLLGAWLLALIGIVGIVPWCAGFVWIVIDSFR